MPGTDSFMEFLRAERNRKKASIEFFETGECGTFQMLDGVKVDTTADWIATLRKHVSELDDLLRDEIDA